MIYTVDLEIFVLSIFWSIKFSAHLIFVGRWSDKYFIYCELIFMFLIFVTRANDKNILTPKISRSTVYSLTYPFLNGVPLNLTKPNLFVNGVPVLQNQT